MRLRDALLGLAALAAVLPAAGCGTSDAAASTATTRVTMAKSYRFEPQAIAVPVGATVTWKNDDNFTHAVQVDGQEDHELAGEDADVAVPGLRAHLAGCPACREEYESLREPAAGE